jgi:hypothetical protein
MSPVIVYSGSAYASASPLELKPTLFTPLAIFKLNDFKIKF